MAAVAGSYGTIEVEFEALSCSADRVRSAYNSYRYDYSWSPLTFHHINIAQSLCLTIHPVIPSSLSSHPLSHARHHYLRLTQVIPTTTSLKMAPKLAIVYVSPPHPMLDKQSHDRQLFLLRRVPIQILTTAR